MINNITSQNAVNTGELQVAKKNRAAVLSNRVGEENKVEKLRAMIESGEYRIDLRAVAEKMAEQLRPEGR